MAKINTYRSGSAASLNPVNNTVTPPVTTPATPSAASFKMPTGEKWLNLAVSSIFPGLLYWSLSSLLLSHGVNFFLSHIIGYGLALMLFGYIQTVFKSGSELAKPIQIILTFILILCLSLHYLPDYGKINKTQSTKSETFSFTSDERWATKVSFPKDKKYRITVKGTPVNLINGKEFSKLESEHGPYTFTTNSEGSPTFDGISHQNGSRSVVTVEWE